MRMTRGTLQTLYRLYSTISHSVLQSDSPIQKAYLVKLRATKGVSESVYRRRTDNTMGKRKSTKGQTMI